MARRRAGGKLDLLVTLDFRMSTTCVYSDIVLPTATWYEEGRPQHLDMHPSFTRSPRRSTRWWKSDWEIYKGIAKAFSKSRREVLGVERIWC